MTSNTSQLVVRTSKEPMGGIWIGVMKTGAVTTLDTADLADATYGHPGIRRVLWATINGTANEGYALCTASGSSVITVGSVTTGKLVAGVNVIYWGTGTDISDGEMLVIAEEKT